MSETRQNAAIHLNDDHRRVLLTTFMYIDELISTGVATASLNSPLGKIHSDLSESELRTASDYISRIRERCLQALSQLGIEAPRPQIPASQSMGTAAMFAETALYDASPRRLRGYGTLDAEAEAQIDRIEADLAQLLRQFRTFLDR